MTTDQLYRQQVIDHYKNPRNLGVIKDTNIKQKLANRFCGDEIIVYLVVENDKLKDFKFMPQGCAISVAAASLLSEKIIGMEIKKILKLDINFIEELLGTKLTSSRIKCGLLALDAVKQALRKYIKKYNMT